MLLNIRKYFFHINDLLKGGTINKHLNDIRDIVSNPESLDSKKKIEIRKTSLLTHALKNVKYYNDNNIDEIKLENFPVINKNIIRDNIQDFVASGYNINELFKVVTSGSTGTPFSVYQDSTKKKRNSADTIYFGSLAGYEIGVRLNYLKIWTIVNKKSKLKALLENINPIDVTTLSDEAIGELVKNINSDNNKKAFLGYASALESICRYLDKHNSSITISNVVSIIAMSEGISDYAKSAIYKYFKKHPVSRYSNVENGILAQQKDDGSNIFVVNWASYFIEILEMDSDVAVPLGKAGRIVVTDYFNHAMPIIRYDTGDIGVLDWNETKGRKILTKIEGRKMDLVFDTIGNLVSSFTITNNMWLYPEIKQYQFIQLSKKEYLFKLNLEGNFEREELLISEFKNYFGLDANIKVEYVDEIPLLNSGKRKKVMNISV
jgi:phenylacetate-CoA ligase